MASKLRAGGQETYRVTDADDTDSEAAGQCLGRVRFRPICNEHSKLMSKWAVERMRIGGAQITWHNQINGGTEMAKTKKSPIMTKADIGQEYGAGLTLINNRVKAGLLPRGQLLIPSSNEVAWPRELIEANAALFKRNGRAEAVEASRRVMGAGNGNPAIAVAREAGPKINRP